MHHPHRSSYLVAQAIAGIAIPVGLVIGLLVWPRSASAGWQREPSLLQRGGNATETPTPTSSPNNPASPAAPPLGNPTLEDFWNGKAIWAMETRDTGLPIGESDTVH